MVVSCLAHTSLCIHRSLAVLHVLHRESAPPNSVGMQSRRSFRKLQVTDFSITHSPTHGMMAGGGRKARHTSRWSDTATHNARSVPLCATATALTTRG